MDHGGGCEHIYIYVYIVPGANGGRCPSSGGLSGISSWSREACYHRISSFDFKAGNRPQNHKASKPPTPKPSPKAHGQGLLMAGPFCSCPKVFRVLPESRTASCIWEYKVGNGLLLGRGCQSTDSGDIIGGEVLYLLYGPFIKGIPTDPE